MINTRHLKDFVIDPALHELDMHSEAAVQLLLATAAVESDIGTYLRQYIGDPDSGIYGAARGSFGHENRTIDDLINTTLKKFIYATSDEYFYIKNLDGTESKLQKGLLHTTLAGDSINAPEVEFLFAKALPLESDLKLAAKLCRLHYYRFPEPLPDHGDKEGMWKYYKKYWNTELGATTRDKFMDKCDKYGVWSY